MHVLLCLHGDSNKARALQVYTGELTKIKKKASNGFVKPSYVPKHPPLLRIPKRRRLNTTWFSIVQGLDVSRVQRIMESVLAEGYSWVYLSLAECCQGISMVSCREAGETFQSSFHPLTQDHIAYYIQHWLQFSSGSWSQGSQVVMSLMIPRDLDVGLTNGSCTLASAVALSCKTPSTPMDM